jgi:hypothetical protein
MQNTKEKRRRRKKETTSESEKATTPLETARGHATSCSPWTSVLQGNTIALVAAVKWWQPSALHRVEQRWMNYFTE